MKTRSQSTRKRKIGNTKRPKIEDAALLASVAVLQPQEQEEKVAVSKIQNKKPKKLQSKEEPDFAIIACDDGGYYVMKLCNHSSGVYMTLENNEYVEWRDNTGCIFICSKIPRTAVACRGTLDHGRISKVMLDKFFENPYVCKDKKAAKAKIATLLTPQQRKSWKM